jgi:hypothetical protein
MTNEAKLDALQNQEIEFIIPWQNYFACISNLDVWSAYFPAPEAVPALCKYFSGAPTDKGAVYKWTSGRASNGRLEEGQLEILDLVQPSDDGDNLEIMAHGRNRSLVGSLNPAKVLLDLTVEEPYHARATIELILHMQSDSWRGKETVESSIINWTAQGDRKSLQALLADGIDERLNQALAALANKQL